VRDENSLIEIRAAHLSDAEENSSLSAEVQTHHASASVRTAVDRSATDERAGGF
jgi:hypothetical protein